ncbi:MAG: hypothetical protein ACI9N1_003197 [Flavobacteriales bacterium]|jgi:hypothetical protein
MIKWMISIVIVTSVLVSCAEETTVEKESQKEKITESNKGLSAGQQAAINFCNCTHVKDSLDREDCYGTWVAGISKDSSIVESEAKVMGKLMFECNPEETLRVLLLIEE